jgi:hypothetical protein
MQMRRKLALTDSHSPSGGDGFPRRQNWSEDANCMSRATQLTHRGETEGRSYCLPQVLRLQNRRLHSTKFACRRHAPASADARQLNELVALQKRKAGVQDGEAARLKWQPSMLQQAAVVNVVVTRPLASVANTCLAVCVFFVKACMPTNKAATYSKIALCWTQLHSWTRSNRQRHSTCLLLAPPLVSRF